MVDNQSQIHAELLLLTDDKFSNTASTIGAELVREGVIGSLQA